MRVTVHKEDFFQRFETKGEETPWGYRAVGVLQASITIKCHLEMKQIPEAFSNTENQGRDVHKANFKCIQDAAEACYEDGDG